MYPERFARYWMNTCADAERMNIDIGVKRYYRYDSDEPPQPEKHFFHVPYDALEAGILPANITAIIFNSIPDKEKAASDEVVGTVTVEGSSDHENRTCEVLVCPVYLSSVSEHARRKVDDGKAISRVTPVWIPAILQEDGTLLHTGDDSSPWIPREYLDPVDHTGRYAVIGALDDLDRYVTQTRGAVDFEVWQEVFGYATGMVEHVVNVGNRKGEPRGITELAIEDYERILFEETDKSAGIILVLGEKNGRKKSTVHIEKLYEDMLFKRRFPDLFCNLVSYETPALQPVTDGDDGRDASICHVGQMGGRYPLVSSQREALHRVLLMQKKGDSLLAVNGPPGTGKTTLIQSVVASLWVKAAIAGTEPPLIVGTSANNQAVKNIIECFGKTEPPDEDTDEVSLLRERWLPGVKSYGAYCAPRGRRGNSPAPGDDKLDEGKYQLVFRSNDNRSGLFDVLLQEDALSDLEEGYLEKAGEYIAGNKGRTDDAGRPPSAYPRTRSVGDVIQILHEEMKEICEKQKEIVNFTYELKTLDRQIREGVERALAVSGGKDLGAFKNELKEEMARTEETCREIESSRKTFCARPRPFWLVWGAWLGFIKKEIARRNLDACLKGPFDITDRVPAGSYLDEDAIVRCYGDVLEETKTGLERIKSDYGILKMIEDMEEKRSVCMENRDRALDSFGITEENGDPERLDSLLDTKKRYRLFLLATHYWEGRWLIEASRLHEEKKRTGRKDVFPWHDQWGLRQWQNYAKVTPCFVATAFMLPSYLRGQKGQPLYEGIDYLIIDEAGQVPPEVVAGCFALAKKAIVIGDTQQIEPVWRVTSPVDEGNIEKHGLHQNLPEVGSTPATDRGLTSYKGNILKSVQGRVPYSSTGDEAQRGIMLREHFRCVPEIIGYCNELAYKGHLIPSRKGIEGYVLPHLGYAHIRGMCESRNGSKRNEDEAECIVRWITDNMERLGQYYSEREGKGVAEQDLVAVVTPFAAQSATIGSALKRAGKGHVIVGTTHALQGAEKKVVIFSPVYDDRHPGGYFFDKGVNMLNVAVSRAKDSFLVFGDMNLFRESPHGSPSRLLGRYLFNSSDNEITNVRVPQKRIPEKPIDVLDTVEKHVDALRRAIQEAKQRVIIYSPWLSKWAVERDALDTIIRKKLESCPGTSITICVDKNSNQASDKKDNYTVGKELLLAAGAKVLELEKIHQKIIVIDDAKYMVGSFNWLSASRQTDPCEPYYLDNRTIVYSGPKVGKMIERELDYIRARERNIEF